MTSCGWNKPGAGGELKTGFSVLFSSGGGDGGGGVE